MQPSTELKSLHSLFQKMVEHAPEKDTQNIREMKQFMVSTVQKLERIRKKKDPTDADFCYFVMGSKIKTMAERIVNSYMWVSKNPKALKKFYKLLSSFSLPASKLSLSRLKKPLETLGKKHDKLTKIKEEDLEPYCEKLGAPLDKFSSELIQRMNRITSLVMS